MSRELLPPWAQQIKERATARSSRMLADDELSDAVLMARIRLKDERHRWAGRAALGTGAGAVIAFLALLL